MANPGSRNPRLPDVSLPGDASGRFPSFLPERIHTEMDRPHGPLQDQHAPLAPDGCRGMAGRDQEIPRTDPYSSMENPDRLERMVDRQGSAISGRRHTRGVRGILHARGYTGDRGLRYRSTRGDHSRNRNARPFGGNIHRLPAIMLFRKSLPEWRILHRERGHIRIH